MKRHLTISQAALRLGVQVDTLRKLENAGEILADRTEGGHRRFSLEEIDLYRRSSLKGGADTPKRRSATRPAPARREKARSRRMTDESLATSVEITDEYEENVYELAPTRRPSRVAPAWPPQPVGFALARPPTPMSVVDSGPSDRVRLQTIKADGRSAIPWGIPVAWEGEVIADLERFVTPIRFPADLSTTKAQAIVRARVADVLRPYQDAEAEAKRAKKAKAEADRRHAQLIAQGNTYAWQETRDWDRSVRIDACNEVRRVLERDVEDDWTEVEMQTLVDEILDEYDESEDDYEVDGEDWED